MKKTLLIVISIVFINTLLLAQENFNTSRLGQWPYGRCSNGEIIDNYLIVNNGRTIQAYDITDPDSLQLYSEIFIDDVVLDFKVRDNLIYLCGSSGKFMILDFSNPSQIEVLSSLETEAIPDIIRLNGDYAYLHHNLHGIYIYNISDPTNPVLAGQQIILFNALDMQIYDNKAFLATSVNGIEVYDITNPLDFSPLGNYDTTGYFKKLIVSGDSLFALNSSKGIMLLDISNPGNIQFISHTDSLYYPLSISKYGNTVVVTTNYSGLYLYDFSNPENPLLIGSHGTSGYKVIITENFNCQVAASGIYSLDLSNPLQINVLDVIKMPQLTQYICYSDNVLYTHGDANALRIFDVSDPSSPAVIYEETNSSNYFVKYAEDNLLFIGYSFGIHVFDVSEPHSPVILDTIYIPRSLRKIDKLNNLLILADFDSITLYDISNIHAVVSKSSIDFDRGLDFIAEGNTLYVLTYDGIDIYDISDPDNITLIASPQIYRCHSFSKHDNLIYISCNHNTNAFHYLLRVFDVSDPANPTQVNQLDHDSPYYRVIAEDGYLYVFKEETGIFIYDLVVQDQPELCGFYAVNHYLQSADIRDGNIYIPRFFGFDILHNDLFVSADHIFIPEKNRLKIFPNPASEFVRFDVAEKILSGKITYRLISLNGQIVKEGNISPDNTLVPVKNLPKGGYILNVLYNGVSKNGMFQKL